jgi:hypothetical protein
MVMVAVSVSSNCRWRGFISPSLCSPPNIVSNLRLYNQRLQHVHFSSTTRISNVNVQNHWRHAIPIKSFRSRNITPFRYISSLVATKRGSICGIVNYHSRRPFLVCKQRILQYSTDGFQKSLFWESVVASIFALGASVTMMYIFPSGKEHLLQYEGMDSDAGRQDMETKGVAAAGSYSSMAFLATATSSRQENRFHENSNESSTSSSVEMAFHQPHAIPEPIVKAKVTSSHSVPVAAVKNSFSITKPYNVSSSNMSQCIHPFF